MKRIIASAVLLAASACALAKLPALNDEAKAKAAEAAGKSAWSAKVDNYLLCKSQDKVAGAYYVSSKAAGKETKSAAATPACADPGPFALLPPAAAATSQPATGAAVSPVGTKPPEAAAKPAKKS